MKQSIDGRYRAVKDTFWTDIVVLDLLPEEKLFYLWLFTNQHLDTCGCYQVNIKTIEYETGLSPLPLIQKFEALGRIKYNSENKEIILLKWKNNNKGFFDKRNRNSIKAIRTGLNNVKTLEFRHIIMGWLGDEIPSTPAPTVDPTPAPTQGVSPNHNHNHNHNHNLSTTAIRAQDQLISAISENQPRLNELFPDIDLAISTEKLLSHYRDGPVLLDPYLVALQWFQNEFKPGATNGNRSSSRTAQVGRKTGLIEANGAGTDFLS